MLPVVLAQVLSLINGGFLLASMRCKNKDKFLVLNSISNAFGFASMMVLGAYAAAIGPIVLTVQGLVSHYFEKKGQKQPNWMLPIYILLSVLGGLVTVNSVLSLLPVLSSCLASAMLMSKDMKTSRKIGLLSSSVALPYLVVSQAYVAALVFASSFVNTLDAIYKLDIKPKKNDEIIEENVVENKLENEEKKLELDLEKDLGEEKEEKYINCYDNTVKKEKTLTRTLKKKK